MMTKLLIALCLLAAPVDSTLLMFWNLENFFDWRADPTDGSDSDKEFSSFGARHWTRRKFDAKCRAIAKTIFWVEDQEGMLPDAIGVAEVENRFVLEKLLSETPLRRTDYDIVHYDSPDPRGIDVALLYRKNRLKLLRSRPLRVGNPSGKAESFTSRDILLAEFGTPDGDSIALFVNHHPSKYGGDSGWKRQVAMGRLKEATDSLLREGFKNIVATGDFNDTPESMDGYARTMVNLAAPLAWKGRGTIRYAGKWELIDMFLVSPALAGRRNIPEMKILRVPFLLVQDHAHSGEKPLRTYTGPKYAGGVSDHCPIVLVIQHLF